MKSTIDLPSDLVREMKLRAVHEGRKLKDIAAELLRSALAPDKSSATRPVGAATPKTLPVLKATRTADCGAVDAQEFVEFIKQADVDLDVTRHEKTLGH